MKFKQFSFGLFAILLISFFILQLSFSFVGAGTLQVTTEHPFLVDGEWISASSLEIGDELTLINGSKVKITSITEKVFEDNFSVYNLEALEYSDFVVNSGDGLDVVVHNSAKPKSGNPLTTDVTLKKWPRNSYFDGRTYVYGADPATIRQSEIDAFTNSILASELRSLANPQAIPELRAVFSSIKDPAAQLFLQNQLLLLHKKGYSFWTGSYNWGGFVSHGRALDGAKIIGIGSQALQEGTFSSIFAHEYYHINGFLNRNFFGGGVNPDTIVGEAYWLPGKARFQPRIVGKRTVMEFTCSSPNEHLKINDVSLISLDEINADVYALLFREFMATGKVTPLNSYQIASLKTFSNMRHDNVVAHGSNVKFGDSELPTNFINTEEALNLMANHYGNFFTPISPGSPKLALKLDYCGDF